ncbi:D-cysteine desulfhydrase [soil metagenome]
MSFESIDQFPRVALCQLPTPLERLENLEHELGAGSPQIWIKRDDLTGLAFGGNKVRKLEFLIGDALNKKATIVVTEGGTQSNHARLTAAAAARSGLPCRLILDGSRGFDKTGNLLLDHLLGAQVEIVLGGDERQQRMEMIGEEMVAAGEIPYVIRTGGSTPVGALGYVNAYQELAKQFNERSIEPVRVYCPTSSQGTLAGLTVGVEIAGSTGLIQAIAVEKDSLTLRADALPIANGAFLLFGMATNLTVESFSVDDHYVGEGYGIPTREGLEAIRLLARLEGILLDPVYSSKAMAGLINHIRGGVFSPEESVVFVHTGGGPALFAYRDALVSLVDSAVSTV